jgi:hypothetical protein
MAVLEAPAQHRKAAAAKTPRKRRPRQPMPLPMLALGTMVVLALGFGAGTVAQFDNDWRTGQPNAVEVASGTMAAGADLAATVQSALADKLLPVKHVACADPVSGGGGAGKTVVAAGSGLINPQMQLCRAQTTSGMVNVVTERSGDQVAITVFLAE